jgi:hypothetical protein
VQVGRLLAILQPEAAGGEVSILNHRDSATLRTRRLNAERSRANGKVTSRLKKKPTKSRKPAVKKPVRHTRSS